MAAARTGQGETPIQHIRMAADLWEALKARAKEVDGVSGPEVMRRLAMRYVSGEIKAGPARAWTGDQSVVRSESAGPSKTPEHDQR
ncbi:hypothetical protein ACIHFD_56530 [Nonomuraea sp. NPDC051941]|uniref:hypothetical protein n=1 Tax=Nonomuraea sp. NPDC051941 TaxID=3364373 RepID=UPI0037C79947